MARYNTTTPSAITRSDERYEYLFENRDPKIIYKIAMREMNALSNEERKAINTREYTWRANDQYWKVAKRFYGDSRLWFIIAYYNKAPTDFHLQKGQNILVPMAPQVVLDKLGL